MLPQAQDERRGEARISNTVYAELVEAWTQRWERVIEGAWLMFSYYLAPIRSWSVRRSTRRPGPNYVEARGERTIRPARRSAYYPNLGLFGSVSIRMSAGGFIGSCL